MSAAVLLAWPGNWELTIRVATFYQLSINYCGQVTKGPLGLAEILASREIPLVVSFAGKRELMRGSLRRGSSRIFAMSLRWLQPNRTLLCGRAVSQSLDLRS